jgi:hypothetical protein
VSYSTPNVELPLVLTIVFIFAGVIALRLIVLAIRHFAPAEKLSPSVAETMRGRPELDVATRTVVFLLVLCVIGLFASAVLATYTYSTPGAEFPVVIISVSCAIIAVVIKVVDVAVRHFTGR